MPRGRSGPMRTWKTAARCPDVQLAPVGRNRIHAREAAGTPHVRICESKSRSTRPVVRKNKSRPLRGLLQQAVFVMQATEHRRLRNAETRWQLVSMAAGRNFVLGGFR